MKNSLIFTNVVDTKTYKRWVSNIKYPNGNYIIAMYSYDSSIDEWVEPYYMVYFKSMGINNSKHHKTYEKAVKAAETHYEM